MSKDTDVEQAVKPETGVVQVQPAIPEEPQVTTPTTVSTTTTVIAVTNGEKPLEVTPPSGAPATPATAEQPATTIAGIELATPTAAIPSPSSTGRQ